ncbi:hypothetical protein MKK88_33575 [Methylobacterium sp. E-005]|uniref:hypothetical protein n=1 Tax=Methylobacterium sp. E-005 TaxID=2836549 RepID=UPI001FB905CE|nr:hypothetical protein [Methylobacterium sp. E-005]MCJ2090877.1 hypothetical protein [Methylobacterium sp. E-005]
MSSEDTHTLRTRLAAAEAERLPDEIVKAIDSLHHWAFMQGAVPPGTTSGNRAEELAYAKRSALEVTILRHLSAALARAERAEKALGSFETTGSDLRWLSQNVPPGMPAERAAIDRLIRDHKRMLAALSSVAEEA